MEKVELCCGDKVSGGQLEVREFSNSQRITRAIIAGVIGIVISAALVLIPILHFFLVPIGLIITFAIVSRRLKTDRVIISGEGTCPACAAPFHILKRGYKLPFTDVCEKCSRQVQVR